MKVNNIEELAATFKNNICPLLDEYFYDQRDKIATVLNKSPLFVQEKGDNQNSWEWAGDDAFVHANNYTTIYK